MGESFYAPMIILFLSIGGEMITNNLPQKLPMQSLYDVTNIQAVAFQNDPLWIYLIPNPEKRAKILKGFFVPAFRVYLRNQQVYGYGNPLNGIAIWSTPSDKPSPLAFLPSIPGFIGLVFNPFIFKFTKAFPIFAKFDAMKKQYAQKPYYYLNTISVRPEAQGQGIASKLIKPFLAKADLEGANAYTETITPENVNLYIHYGFQVMEEYPVPNTELRLWSFYRKAQEA